MNRHHIDSIFNEMIEDVRYINIYSKVYAININKNNQ